MVEVTAECAINLVKKMAIKKIMLRLCKAFMKKQITLPQESKMKMLSKMALVAIISLTGVSAMDYTAIYGEGKEQIKLATGSPGELGLLKELAKAFNAKYDSLD